MVLSEQPKTMQTKAQHQKSLEYRINSLKTPKSVISWESRITGLKGAGKPVPTADAVFAVNEAERDFPDIDHWISEA